MKKPLGLLRGAFVIPYIPSAARITCCPVSGLWCYQQKGELENDYFSIVYIDYNPAFAIQGALLIR